MHKKVTSVDVAKLAGVSQSTVSRTFSMDERITEETRERVLWAARQLGYMPNALARSLITRRTGIIGIVMAEMTALFYPYVLEKFSQKLQTHGKQVMLFSISPEQEMKDTLPVAMQYQVDGVIITSATISSPLADECAQHNIPVILFNRYVKGAAVSAVSCDNEQGAKMGVEHLLKTGHQHFAYISGKSDTSTNRDRQQGFERALAEAGIADWIHEPAGDYGYYPGKAAALRLWQGGARPDAIFCANDATAMGVMDALRFELGVRIPQDVSILGFDDIPHTILPTYDLTTIRQQVDQMIDTTIELLLRKLNDPNTQDEYHLVPAVLVKRGTVLNRLNTT